MRLGQSIGYVSANSLVRKIASQRSLDWRDTGAFSNSSRNRLRSSPPAYPVRLPSLPTTRWHGMTILIGFLPLAKPTARIAALLPIASASWA
jgi:hypothetical protein